MQGQQSLFKRERLDRYEIRVDYDIKKKAQAKAKKDGYSLARLVKCFITGYLAGDLLADTIMQYERKN